MQTSRVPDQDIPDIHQERLEGDLARFDLHDRFGFGETVSRLGDLERTSLMRNIDERPIHREKSGWVREVGVFVEEDAQIGVDFLMNGVLERRIGRELVDEDALAKDPGDDGEDAVIVEECRIVEWGFQGSGM